MDDPGLNRKPQVQGLTARRFTQRLVSPPPKLRHPKDRVIKNGVILSTAKNPDHLSTVTDASGFTTRLVQVSTTLARTRPHRSLTVLALTASSLIAVPG